jgi:hypothetical protein
MIECIRPLLFGCMGRRWRFGEDSRAGSEAHVHMTLWVGNRPSRMKFSGDYDVLKTR